MALDNGGNTLGSATRLNLTSTTQTVTDFVGASDLNDFYSFSVGSRSSLNLAIGGLIANADVQIIQDKNRNGIIDVSSEVVTGSYLTGTANESIKTTLETGNYFIRIYPGASTWSVPSTNYSLNISANSTPSGLQFNLSNPNLKPTDTISINGGWAYDADGVKDITLIDFQIFQNDVLVNSLSNDLAGSKIIPNVSDSRGGSFTHSLSLAGLNLAGGNYTLRAFARDTASNSSMSVQQLFTVNTAANSLGFYIDNPNVSNTGTLNISRGFVADPNGVKDVTLIDFQIFQNDVLVNSVSNDLAGSKIIQNVSDSRGGSFTHSLSLAGLNLAGGNYTLRASARDTANNTSVAVQQLFTVNTAPTSLTFNIDNPTVSNTGTLNISRGQVYDANGVKDVSLIDFQILQDGKFINPVTNDLLGSKISPNTSDNRLGSFTHSLSLAGLNLAGGNYTLRAIARDTLNNSSQFVERQFTIDLAGNALSTARQINVGSTISTYKDGVSNLDTHDYYRFTLSEKSNFKLSLSGLSGNANVHLLDITGINIIGSSNALNNSNEFIDQTLNPGTYYIRIFPVAEISTNYNLDVSATKTLLEWNVSYINRNESNYADYNSYNFGNPIATTKISRPNSNLHLATLKDLSGTPTYTEGIANIASNLSKNWVLGAPPNTPTDNFSARYKTEQYFAPGLYKINLNSDDGVRVRIDNQLIIDRWVDNAGSYLNYFRSTGKHYNVTIEYKENWGGAAISYEMVGHQAFDDHPNSTTEWVTRIFHWDGVGTPSVNIDDHVANDIGTIKLARRNDGRQGISADWGAGSPNGDSRLPSDSFIMRSYTNTYFEAGHTYKAWVRADDGYQLFAKHHTTNQWVFFTPENQWMQDAYGAHREITFSVNQSGWYDFHFHLFEGGGNTYFDLSWEDLTTSKPNENPGFNDFINQYIGSKYDIDDVPAGIVYQCTDWAARFVESFGELGKPNIMRRSEGAKDWFEDFGNSGAKMEWNPQKINNAENNYPEAGDIVVWNSNMGSGYGHVAIADFGSTVRELRVIEQNGGYGGGQGTGEDAIRQKTYDYSSVLGWIRIPAIHQKIYG
jgi:CHAP domain/Bacterial pre-peptidase C-terminal domain/PA14 domain